MTRLLIELFLLLAGGAIEMRHLPIITTYYDPSLGGINCDSDCTTFANMEKVTPDKYGNTAACPGEWLGKTIVIDDKPYVCRDTGGAIGLDYDDYFEMIVVRIDILARSEDDICNYCLYNADNWELIE